MSDKVWTRVDNYLNAKLVPADVALQAALEANATAGLPSIDVTPTQGRFLHLVAKMAGAKRILEIGTLGGYSTIWLGRALPEDGQLISLEYEPHHAAVARSNIARAGLSQVAEVRVGPAADSLEKMADAGEAAFDLIFIDADKPNNPVYLEWALKLSHPGTVIICDNVIRDGKLADADSNDPAIQGTRAMFDLIARDPRLVATALQTVGAKGYDGFMMAVVL